MPEAPPESIALVYAPAAEAGKAQTVSAVEQEVVELFDQWRRPLLRYLMGFSLATPDSEDIIQETFLAVFEHLRCGKSCRHLRGWLFRVAHNLALKHRRNQRGPKNVSESTMDGERCADPGPNPEELYVEGQTQKRLTAVLQALPEQNRRCLCLRAEGLRYREIAEVLDISLGSVSACLERSLAQIARAVKR